MEMSKIVRKKIFQLSGWVIGTLMLSFDATSLSARPLSPRFSASVSFLSANTAANKLTNTSASATLFLPSSIALPSGHLPEGKSLAEQSVLSAPAAFAGAVVLASGLNPLETSSPWDALNTGKKITCYPNPAISYINFKFDSVDKKARLFIYSFTGRKMNELAITGNILKISLDNYYRGLYVYQLRDEHGSILESGKFQVKN